MKAAEIREKTIDELSVVLLELRKEQFNLRMQNGTGQLAQIDQFNKIRKDVARVKTVINEKSGNE